MVDSTCGSGFATETLYGLLVRDQLGVQDLDCDGSLNRDIGGTINSAHTASTQFSFDAVLSFEEPTYKSIFSIFLDKCSAVCRTEHHIVRILLAATGTNLHWDSS